MSFKIKRTFLALVAVTATASVAFAIQTQVMIQGYLTNGSGTPYTTAQATEFRVYQGGNATTAGSGTLYYDETATITPSASGVFNYPLGSGSPTVPLLVVVGGGTIPNVLSTTTFDTASAVYLEISVGGNVILPRLQMLGTPYSALSGTSENLKPTSQPLISTNYLQASSGTFTASGNNQASIVTSSGIIVNGGGVTAPFFNGTFYGTVVGGVSGGAGSVAAVNVTPGTFVSGVLVPPQNVIGGVASTNTANTFPLVQTFQGGVVSNSESVANGLTAASGTFTASGSNQASIVTSSGIIVNGGGVTAPFFNGMLTGNVPATNVTGALALLNGGTGATTAAGAQTNLGVASSTGAGASGIWPISITGSAGSVAGAPPIGAVILYAGSSEPLGWIECNGRSMSQTGSASASWGIFTTPALFTAIGIAWGSAGPGVFNAPDLRGIFPRGWNHGKTGSYSDPDAASRTNEYTSGTTGDNVGSYQADQLRSHTHTIAASQFAAPGNGEGGNLGGSAGSPGTTSGITTSTGGNETRPQNASFMYIMRVQ